LPGPSCNSGLQCTNNVCVASNQGSGGGSATSSGQGGDATGGTSTGEGGATAGGTTAANGGSSNATGGSTAATGGGTSCGDTASDPNNCGKCGHVCKSKTCNNGVCAAVFGPCFTGGSGYSNCEAACAANNQTCVARGCEGDTFRGWATMPTCTDESTYSRKNSNSCDESFETGGFSRCCCTDN
jgi:hypothetical protein